MRISVLGVGAVGGTLAALLTRAGHDVQAVARGATLAQLREHGIRMRGAAGSFVAEVAAGETVTADAELVEFTRQLAELRHNHPTFRRRHFFSGRIAKRGEGEGLPDVVWLSTDGSKMESEDWNEAFVRAMGYFLNGDAITGRDAWGQRITDKSFLIYFNASETDVEVTLPSNEISMTWEVVVDTARGGRTHAQPGDTFVMPQRSMVVLREWSEADAVPTVTSSISTIKVNTPPTDQTPMS